MIRAAACAAVDAALVVAAVLMVFFAFAAGSGFWPAWWLGVAVTAFAGAALVLAALRPRKGGGGRG